MTIARIFGALVLAFFANMLVVSVAEFLLSLAYPPPRGVLSGTPQMMQAYVRGLPALAFVGLLLGWAAGAVAASATGFLVSGRAVWAAWAGAAINLFGVVVSAITLPHPLPVVMVGLAMPFVSALSVTRLLAPRGGPESLSQEV